MTFSPVAALKGVGRKLRSSSTGAETQTKRAAAGERRFLRDARSSFPDYAFDTVFDVGAHVGEVSALFLSALPDVVVHAFEPGPEAFARLAVAVDGDRRAVANRLALSARAGVSAFSANGAATTNRLVDAAKAASTESSRRIDVEVTTGDAYCADAGIDHISFLKIDTEGHDLDVLVGFAGLLQRQAIDFVQVEAGMHPDNTRHVPFGVLKDHLEAHGYRLFRLYEQRGQKRLPILRRCNPMFVSLKLAESYRTT